MYLAFKVDSMTFMVGPTFLLHNVIYFRTVYPILSDKTGISHECRCHASLFFIIIQIIPVIRRALTIQEKL